MWSFVGQQDENKYLACGCCRCRHIHAVARGEVFAAGPCPPCCQLVGYLAESHPRLSYGHRPSSSEILQWEKRSSILYIVCLRSQVRSKFGYPNISESQITSAVCHLTVWNYFCYWLLKSKSKYLYLSCRLPFSSEVVSYVGKSAPLATFVCLFCRPLELWSRWSWAYVPLQAGKYVRTRRNLRTRG